MVIDWRRSAASELRGRSQTMFTKFGVFWPPTPLRLHFLWFKCLQKVDFFDRLSPSSCKRSLWTPSKGARGVRKVFQRRVPILDYIKPLAAYLLQSRDCPNRAMGLLSLWCQLARAGHYICFWGVLFKKYTLWEQIYQNFLELLIFCIYSLNFIFEFFIITFFCIKSAKY